ncbi:Uncharacterised protein [Serratia fonticola]|uniref:Uncharacterized protein n=1 Tax=Serratia fonticola TaxID=47917 RepID=A0A4U9TNX4_SERFO|nr:Uncharacterised protein [Serratia fonticola]VTR21986.1 Uncharacterised protein [Serratia fonticola]
MTVLLNILSWQGNGEMGKQLTLWGLHTAPI